MTERITSGQEKQIVRFGSDAVEAALKGFTLDKDAAQLVIENGDEFAATIREAARTAIARLSVSQQFADEEVESSWGYPDEYIGPAPIAEQIDKLAALFGLSLGETMQFVERALPTLTLPDGAEGWFAIPKVEAIAARHFKNVTNPNERYCRAVLLMLEKIEEARSFYNYRDGEITVDRLRQHARTAAMLERIGETQKGDILVIPSQFGLRHRGRSVRRARAVFAKSEFGHGALAVGSMLLTHPTRLVRWKQLYIDCGGDEFAPGADGQFSFAPIFSFYDEVEFRADFVDDPREDDGTASGFFPQ